MKNLLLSLLLFLNLLFPSISMAATKGPLPSKGYIDNPANGAMIQGQIIVKGWFLDESGVFKIEVLVDGKFIGSAKYGIARKDVIKSYPQYNIAKSGYQYTLNTLNLTNGKHTLTIKETGKNKKNNFLNRTIYVQNSQTGTNKLKIPRFNPGSAYLDIYDDSAVQPTTSNWNGVSRFTGSKALDTFSNIKFTYNTDYGSISTMDNPPVIASDGTVILQEGYIYGPSAMGRIIAINSSDAGMKVKWSHQIGTNNTVPVIGAGGMIYAIGNKNLYAYYPDGTEKWHVYLNTSNPASLALGKDGTILVTRRVDSGNTADTRLDCFLPNGTLKWSYILSHNAFIGSRTPVVASDGTIYCFDSNGYLYSISPSGRLNWKFKTRAYDGILALANDGTIIIEAFQLHVPNTQNSFTDGAIIAVNPNGSLKWERTDLYPNSYPASNLINSPDGLLYTTVYNQIVALNPDGTTKWEFPFVDHQGQPEYGVARLALDKNGNLFALWSDFNSSDQVIIFNQSGDLIRASPLIYNFIYSNDKIRSNPIIGHDGSLYFTTANEEYNKLYRVK